MQVLLPLESEKLNVVPGKKKEKRKKEKAFLYGSVYLRTQIFKYTSSLALVTVICHQLSRMQSDADVGHTGHASHTTAKLKLMRWARESTVELVSVGSLTSINLRVAFEYSNVLIKMYSYFIILLVYLHSS